MLTVKWAVRNGNTDASAAKTQVKFGYMGPNKF